MKLAKMTNHRRFILIFLILFSPLFACRQKTEIPLSIMSKAYVDILVLKEKYISNDSLLAKQDEVFKKYGIDKNLYEQTLKSYQFDNEIWKEFYKKVYVRIDSLKKYDEIIEK